MREPHPAEPSPLYRRISRLRWQAALLALVLVLIHQWIEHAYLFFLPRWAHFGTQVVFYGIVGPSLAWLALTSLRSQVLDTDRAEKAVRQSAHELAEVNRHLEILISVERRLAEADDEDELIETILELPLSVLPARGVSLIRFDEEGNPRPAHHYGDLSPEEFERWTAHLASSEARLACSACRAKRASLEVPCPALDSAPEALGAQTVHCLPLVRSGRDFGSVNIYLGDEDQPTADEADLLQVMAVSMSLALESQELRTRELDTLYHLREIHHLQGLERQLESVLTSTTRALDLDGGAICLLEADGELEPSALITDDDQVGWEFLLGMGSAVKQSDAALVAGEMDFQPGAPQQLRSMAVVPIRKDTEWLGSVLFWSKEASGLTTRQVRIVESIASQLALLVENHRLYREVEYRAGQAERGRLAREIHDGLAQTLGYLKLRAAQIASWIDKGDTQRVFSAIEDIRHQLDEAYTDTREAIDGLRLDPGRSSFRQGLAEIYAEFEALTQIRVQASDPPDSALSLAVVSQLVRIIQEALGNVRKHANASRVWVRWQEDHHSIQLRIQDDGSGFDPQIIPPISRHGLRIMRERAELLGADFQVVSGPGEGTEIVVRLPLSALEQVGQHV